jgi:hypothetical protein
MIVVTLAGAGLVGAPGAIVVRLGVVPVGAVVAVGSFREVRLGFGPDLDGCVVVLRAGRARETVDGARACASTGAPASGDTRAGWDVPPRPTACGAWWRVRRTWFVRGLARASPTVPRCPVATEPSGPITVPTAPPVAQATTTAISQFRHSCRRSYEPGADARGWPPRAQEPDTRWSTEEDGGLPRRPSARRSHN